jgi:hypothetical protein
VRLIFLIAVVFVLLSPRATQDKAHSSGKGNAPNNHAQDHSPTSPVLKSDSAKQTATVADQNVEHRVRIGTPVPVNSIKDTWDKVLVVCTALIVIVGGFQILFLWQTVRATSDNAKAAKAGAQAASANAQAVEAQGGTLKETLAAIKSQVDLMRDQTKAAQDAAKAAADNVELIIDKERARLIIRLDDNPIDRFKGLPDDKGMPVVDLEGSRVHFDSIKIVVSQHGPTTAFNVDGVYRVAFLPSADPPAVEHMRQMNFLPTLIGKSEPIPLEFEFDITESVLEGIQNEEIFVHFFGEITYEDIFGRKHRTPFRYRWDVDWEPSEDGDREDTSDWTRCGPPEDNAAT